MVENGVGYGTEAAAAFIVVPEKGFLKRPPDRCVERVRGLSVGHLQADVENGLYRGILCCSWRRSVGEEEEIAVARARMRCLHVQVSMLLEVITELLCSAIAQVLFDGGIDDEVHGLGR